MPNKPNSATGNTQCLSVRLIADTEVGKGRVLGTARYLAPERSRGSVRDEVRSDIYSLGCVLRDLLGGTERLELMTLSEVPSALAAVVTRAIELEPENRYNAAGELARAARAALEGSTEGEAGEARADEETADRDRVREPHEPDFGCSLRPGGCREVPVNTEDSRVWRVRCDGLKSACSAPFV